MDSLQGRVDTTLYKVVVPGLGQAACDVEDRVAFFYTFQFKWGFHLPLHPFFRTCLAGWGIGAA